MGVIEHKLSLEVVKKVSASAFCRRRLPVVMVKNKMSDSITTATKFVQQGHVRVGPEIVKDPAFIVTRYNIYNSCFKILYGKGIKMLYFVTT